MTPSRAIAIVACITVGATCVLPDDYVKNMGGTEGGGAAGAASPTTGGGGVGGPTSGPGASGGQGGGGQGGAGQGGGGQGGGGQGGGSPGCSVMPAQENFDGTSSIRWTESPASLAGVNSQVIGEELVVTIDDSVGGNFAWYNADRGWFQHLDLCGDFGIAVTVVVRDSGGTMEPGFNFNSAGLLVRNPAQPQSDDFWAMVTIGVQDNATQRAETKATQHSVSDPIVGHDLIGGATLSGRVALCRVGTQVRLSARAPSQAWETLATYDEFQSGAPDGEVSLPADVQVGMVVNGWASQDIQATLDNVELWLPNDIDDCTR